MKVTPSAPPAPKENPRSKIEELLQRGSVIEALRLSCSIYGKGLPEDLKKGIISSWQNLGKDEKVSSFEDMMCILGHSDEKEASAIFKEVEDHLIGKADYGEAERLLEAFASSFSKSSLIKYYARKISFAEGGKRFLVGSLLPLSGKALSIADQILEAAYDVFGLDREWEIYFMDEEKEKVMDVKEGTIFVIGPLFSGTVDRLPEKGVFIAFTQKKFQKRRGILRLNLNPKREIDMLLDWAVGRGLRRFVVIYPDTPLGISLKEAFARCAEERGATVLGENPYQPGTSDFWGAIKKTFYPKPKFAASPEAVSMEERDEIAEKLGEGGSLKLSPSFKSVFNLAITLGPVRYPKFKQDPIGGVDAVFFPDFELPLSLFSSQLYFRGVEGVEIYGVSLANSPSLLRDIGQPENPVYITGFYPYKRGENTPILKLLCFNLFEALKGLVERSFFSGEDPEKAILSSVRFEGPFMGFSVKDGEIYPDSYILKVGREGLVRIYPENTQGSRGGAVKTEGEDKDGL